MRFGIFTPTEAGGVGVLYCLIVGKFVYKGLKKEHFIPILRETISGTATVMLIIVSATVFGYYLNWENIPTMLLNAVTSFASNKFLVLLVMNVVLLIVGMFLEGGAALIILAPLMVPIVKAAGIDTNANGYILNAALNIQFKSSGTLMEYFQLQWMQDAIHPWTDDGSNRAVKIGTIEQLGDNVDVGVAMGKIGGKEYVVILYANHAA